jgi:predicted small lipoprotein YifL
MKLIALLLFALLIAACGVKKPLEMPHNQSIHQSFSHTITFSG